MQNRAVVLPQEVWDRLIQILDVPHVRMDPDASYILLSINNQLLFNPSDTHPKIPPVPILSHKKSTKDLNARV